MDEKYFIVKYLLSATQPYINQPGTSVLLSCLPVCCRDVGLLPQHAPFLPRRTISLTPHSSFATKSLQNTPYPFLCFLKTSSWWPQEKAEASFQTCFCVSRSHTWQCPQEPLYHRQKCTEPQRPTFFHPFFLKEIMKHQNCLERCLIRNKGTDLISRLSIFLAF